MGAFIKQLEDSENNKIYPVTLARCVYMSNGVDTLESVINNITDADGDIVFESNKITKTLITGDKVITEFSGNVITETKYDSENTKLSVKTTTFKDDGSISIRSSEVS